MRNREHFGAIADALAVNERFNSGSAAVNTILACAGTGRFGTFPIGSENIGQTGVIMVALPATDVGGHGTRRGVMRRGHAAGSCGVFTWLGHVAGSRSWVARLGRAVESHGWLKSLDEWQFAWRTHIAAPAVYAARTCDAALAACFEF